MFENSLLSRVPLRCWEHPKNVITHFCTQAKCQGMPLFCEDCMSSYRFKEKHYGHELNIVEISQGIEQLSARVQRDKKTVGGIYRELMGVSGAEGLLKWQQQKQQHFTSIEKHISTIKFQVEEELAGILKRFQDELEQEKNRLYTQLEHFYKNYRDKFDRFSRLAEPIVAMQNRFQFYASPMALLFKISTEAAQPKLVSWLAELKRTLNLAEKASAQPVEYVEQIRRYAEEANDMMDELPRIRNFDYEKEMPIIVNGAVRDVLRALVKLKEARSSQVQRSTSVDSMPDPKWKHAGSCK